MLHFFWLQCGVKYTRFTRPNWKTTSMRRQHPFAIAYSSYHWTSALCCIWWLPDESIQPGVGMRTSYWILNCDNWGFITHTSVRDCSQGGFVEPGPIASIFGCHTTRFWRLMDGTHAVGKLRGWTGFCSFNKDPPGASKVEAIKCCENVNYERNLAIAKRNKLTGVLLCPMKTFCSEIRFVQSGPLSPSEDDFAAEGNLTKTTRIGSSSSANLVVRTFAEKHMWSAVFQSSNKRHGATLTQFARVNRKGSAARLRWLIGKCSSQANLRLPVCRSWPATRCMLVWTTGWCSLYFWELTSIAAALEAMCRLAESCLRSMSWRAGVSTSTASSCNVSEQQEFIFVEVELM